MPGVNKSTIYRTLDLLEETGCVYRSVIEGQTIYHHAEEGHHHHLVCSNCGQTIKCSEELFSKVETLLNSRYGFSVAFRHQIIEGLCRDCSNKED